jgi:hypothetical protein
MRTRSPKPKFTGREGATEGGTIRSTAAPTATGWSEPVAGRELHPLKTYTFSRRTMSPFGLQRVVTDQLELTVSDSHQNTALWHSI